MKPPDFSYNVSVAAFNVDLDSWAWRYGDAVTIQLRSAGTAGWAVPVPVVVILVVLVVAAGGFGFYSCRRKMPP